MGVDVVLEDEAGEGKEELFDTKNHFSHLLFLPDIETTVLLRSIDPYDDTIFNQIQIPQLISELEAMRTRVTNESFRKLAIQQLEQARLAGLQEETIRLYEAAVTKVDARPVVEQLDALIQFARKAQGQAHIHLRFRGD